MVSERNRVSELIKYLKSNNVEVNFCKNKARGNKGFFRACGNTYRIDISKNTSEEEQFRVLLHEFAHYIHYTQDKTLKSLSFVFDDFNDEILDELINLTVDLIPKSSIKPLYDLKASLVQELDNIVNDIKIKYPKFKKSENDKKIESKIKKKGLGLLLKHDRVKVLGMFSSKKYDITNVDKYFTPEEKELMLYLKLKSKQRAINRVTSRISRLNKYYNSNSELFARAFEMYFISPKKVMLIAPNVYIAFNNLINSSNIKLISDCKILFE